MSLDPGAYLGSLEPIGWRFGLDRIQRLLSLLGMPQRRFGSIHVVGTNGKSSVTAMTAELLEAAGIGTGAYFSPHAERWSERLWVGGAEIGEQAFADAVERVAQSVPAVNRTLEEGDVVTQFEAMTAAAMVAFAAAGVRVAVVEAGLGGRLDATNVLPSRATALTSIGLEHTRWLGETELEIAAEKLAVLRDHSALVVGALSAEVRALAERTAAQRHAVLVDASEPRPLDGLGGRAPYLRRNLAVAVAAAEVIAGPLEAELVASVGGRVALPGRMEVLEGEPPIVLDAAHNPDGAAALAEALAEIAGRRPVVACIAVLADKDAAGIMAALGPTLAAAICTEVPAGRLVDTGRPGTTVVPVAELAAAARAAGVASVEEVADPAEAVSRARRLARERGGVALLAGSHYLLGYGS
ncbi:MAG: cyanophycin synthetase [bacterium]